MQSSHYQQSLGALSSLLVEADDSQDYLALQSKVSKMLESAQLTLKEKQDLLRTLIQFTLLPLVEADYKNETLAQLVDIVLSANLSFENKQEILVPAISNELTTLAILEKLAVFTTKILSNDQLPLEQKQMLLQPTFESTYMLDTQRESLIKAVLDSNLELQSIQPLLASLCKKKIGPLAAERINNMILGAENRTLEEKQLLLAFLIVEGVLQGDHSLLSGFFNSLSALPPTSDFTITAQGKFFNLLFARVAEQNNNSAFDSITEAILCNAHDLTEKVNILHLLLNALILDHKKHDVTQNVIKTLLNLDLTKPDNGKLLASLVFNYASHYHKLEMLQENTKKLLRSEISPEWQIKILTFALDHILLHKRSAAAEVFVNEILTAAMDYKNKYELLMPLFKSSLVMNQNTLADWMMNSIFGSTLTFTDKLTLFHQITLQQKELQPPLNTALLLQNHIEKAIAQVHTPKDITLATVAWIGMAYKPSSSFLRRHHPLHDDIARAMQKGTLIQHCKSLGMNNAKDILKLVYMSLDNEKTMLANSIRTVFTQAGLLDELKAARAIALATNEQKPKDWSQVLNANCVLLKSAATLAAIDSATLATAHSATSAAVDSAPPAAADSAPSSTSQTVVAPFRDSMTSQNRYFGFNGRSEREENDLL